MPSNQPSEPFNLPRIIICEGADDVAFFQRLILAWSLPPFHVTSTAKKRSEQGGNTQFAAKLKAITLNRAYGLLENIIVVADNDDNPTASLEALRHCIEEAGLIAPVEPLRRSSGQPSVTIIMLPLNGEPGNLECFCVEEAKNAQRNVAAKSDACVSILEADDWRQSKRGKLWLRIYLAARAADPFISLGGVFREDRYQNLIPLNGAAFKPIAEILGSFCTLSELQVSGSLVQPGRTPVQNPLGSQRRRSHGRS